VCIRATAVFKVVLHWLSQLIHPLYQSVFLFSFYLILFYHFVITHRKLEEGEIRNRMQQRCCVNSHILQAGAEDAPVGLFSLKICSAFHSMQWANQFTLWIDRQTHLHTFPIHIFKSLKVFFVLLGSLCYMNCLSLFKCQFYIVAIY